MFNFIFCTLFIVAAALQYNDPDPYLWVPLYLYTAFLCALAARQKYYRRLYLAGIIGYSFYAVYLLFSKEGVLDWLGNHEAENIAQSMKASQPWIENAREFFGLLIMIIVLLINFFYSKKKLKLL